MDYSPLPAGARELLLQLLAIGYRPGMPQTLLQNASDAAIAWQVQSMLDDYAHYAGPSGWDAIDTSNDAEAA